ncbi:MAG: TlpA disulfide reductase family protein [Gammaproteobacteria bacterium]
MVLMRCQRCSVMWVSVFSVLSLLLALSGVASNAWAQSDFKPFPAKDFTLKTLDGKNFRLAENRGTVILLNFWASWCGPCREELPLLNALHHKYEKLGFTVLGVNIDEKAALAQDLLGEVDVDFPILMDGENSVASLYNIEAMPTTYIIDRSGRVRAQHLGYEKGYEKDYDHDVRQLLRE